MLVEGEWSVSSEYGRIIAAPVTCAAIHRYTNNGGFKKKGPDGKRCEGPFFRENEELLY